MTSTTVDRRVAPHVGDQCRVGITCLAGVAGRTIPPILLWKLSVAFLLMALCLMAAVPPHVCLMTDLSREFGDSTLRKVGA